MEKLEIHGDVKLLIRKQFAAQQATEQVLIQLLIKIATITDDPTGFVRLIMINAEDNVRQAARSIPETDPESLEAANETVRYFEDLSLRLIAGLTPKTVKN